MIPTDPITTRKAIDPIAAHKEIARFGMAFRSDYEKIETALFYVNVHLNGDASDHAKSYCQIGTMAQSADGNNAQVQFLQEHEKELNVAPSDVEELRKVFNQLVEDKDFLNHAERGVLANTEKCLQHAATTLDIIAASLNRDGNVFNNHTVLTIGRAQQSAKQLLKEFKDTHLQEKLNEFADMGAYMARHNSKEYEDYRGNHTQPPTAEEKSSSWLRDLTLLAAGAIAGGGAVTMGTHDRPKKITPTQHVQPADPAVLNHKKILKSGEKKPGERIDNAPGDNEHNVF